MATFQIWMAPLQTVWIDLVRYAPQLLAALLVLLIGIVLAWMVRSLASALFRWMKLDEKFSGIWLFRLWTQELHGHGPSEASAIFLFYAVLFLAIVIAVRLLGFGFGETILNSLLGLLPRVFSFMLILFLGSLMAMFFSVLAQLVLAGSSIKHPQFWGKSIAWSTFGVAIVFSLEQLGAVGKMLSILVLLLFAAGGLALALSFGLGCKDLAREFLIELLKDDKKSLKE